MVPITSDLQGYAAFWDRWLIASSVLIGIVALELVAIFVLLLLIYLHLKGPT